MISLDVHATEKSTYVVTATFKDENEVLVVPNIITWTLTDESGTVINSRTDVSVAFPASVINILLSGLDLAMQPSETAGTVGRVVTVNATYESTLGSNLPLKGEVRFYIDNLLKVT
jgi:hypothetical protein